MFQKYSDKNGVIHITLLLFIILSAYLMTIGSCVILQTSGSMDNIFSIAKPPHFLQMHTGDLDKERIDKFANDQECITQYEIVEMVNMDGADIWYERKGDDAIGLSESMLDNGFVRQTKNFDYLLDLENNVIKQEDGKIGVPISYMKKYDMSIGDTLTIKNDTYSKTYVINSFVRDTQMASSMASSVRFLLSDSDFAELKEHMGEVEYIVEFRLKDSNQAGEVQKAYVAAGLPSNGQGITYPLIKLINALSSELLAGVMILISVLLILLAALNLSYTISAVLEEEIREIGAMKAIGICNKDIRKMYLKKYNRLAVVGCIAGYVAGIGSNSYFTKEIRLMLGNQTLGWKGILFSALAVVCVYWLMMHLSKKILKRIGNITVVQSLVYGETGATGKRKSWLLITVVFFLATNVMLLPMNLMHTVQSKEFTNNMGNSDCDIWMEMQMKDEMKEKCEKLLTALKTDERIQGYEVFANTKCETKGKEETETIQIQWGDYLNFPIHCIQGNSPQKEGEIALSCLNQKKLDKKVGDWMEVVYGDEVIKCRVTGIYQDITSGGYTAKAFCQDQLWNGYSYTVLADCEDANAARVIANEYGSAYPFAKILPTEEYTRQTFGSITDSFGNAAYVAIAAALFIGTLITVLFLKLQIARDASQTATLRVLGFSMTDIIRQYMKKGFFAAFIGVCAGVIWCNTGCEKVVGLVLSLMNSGLAQFQFEVQPEYNLFVCPVLLLGCVLLTTYMCAREIRKHEIVKMLQE